ncbi:lactosylceramide 4-alpha-galactosyltransferase-like [Contarinia nasturtii]|uniref:lactosylceramide 4-alpha-galactosyltransferase-like n=1 Tax=Contarinia nasturtii TaxID=265458 RepID=UPI0012D46D44|nr:lactosylceramide 4-alpha-galactosyltransferase-like [Contarinia nasturtii]
MIFRIGKMTAHRSHYLRYLLLLAIVLVIIITIFTDSSVLKKTEYTPNETDDFTPKPQRFENISDCYKSPGNKDNGIRYFDDILDAKIQPKPGKTIFFHQTTCSKTGIVKLNAKEACAVESAARHNPDRDIFVIFASPVGVIETKKELPQFYNKLQVYSNIHVRNMNIWRYSSDTPISSWLTSSKLFDSMFLYEHMSDIVRAMTLYRYGGYHMDLDVIVQKNIDELGENFIGDDWATVINGAVMHLNNHGVGREISQRFFGEIMKNFNGDSFIGNGPQMLTHILEEICSTPNRTLWTPNRCQGAKIQPKETFYPISWSNYTLYFEPEDLNKALKLCENSTVIHVWNDRSKDIWNKVGIENAYQVIAAKNCPLVYYDSEIF